ncbi:MAG: hypothetical protein ACKD6N_03325 [Candidatus Bathyarchaeota archaeon]
MKNVLKFGGSNFPRFTLKAFQPLNIGRLLESVKKFKITPHGKDYYSSSIQGLNNMLGVVFKGTLTFRISSQL